MSNPDTASFRYFTWVRTAAVAASLMIMLSSCSKTDIQNTSGIDASSTEVLPSMEPAELFGTFDEDEADELVVSINVLRTAEGLEPYVIDEDLMAWARVRAAEIVILFGHKRLDGSSILSAYPGDSVTKYESSLAMGYDTAQVVIQNFQEDNTQRSRMLNAEYTHIGVACLNYNGWKYWAMVYLLP